jgi:hypothetical protein
MIRGVFTARYDAGTRTRTSTRDGYGEDGISEIGVRARNRPKPSGPPKLRSGAEVIQYGTVPCCVYVPPISPALPFSNPDRRFWGLLKR